MNTAFDTSGAVGEMPGWRTPVPSCNRFMRWYDLSPFTQGYIEALFSSSVAPHTMWPCRFQDLAPDTLARIIADCEARVADRGVANRCDGAWFWNGRQSKSVKGFPPLTVQLGDDGKVRFAA